MTLPVSSEATLIPTVAGASSCFRKTSVIRDCSSAIVLVVFEIFAWDEFGVGEADGLLTASGVGVGLGDGDGDTVTCRSRPGLCCALLEGTVAKSNAINRSQLIKPAELFLVLC
jgi:hypothetical protein